MFEDSREHAALVRAAREGKITFREFKRLKEKAYLDYRTALQRARQEEDPPHDEDPDCDSDDCAFRL